MIIVLLANGFEEIEALTPVDVLRRANFDVKTVGVSGKTVVGSHGIPVVCDMEASALKLDEVTMAIFPGGMPGALNLDAAAFTDEVISAVTSRGGRLAAICAAPLVLGRRGLLDGKRATCFPGFENELRGAVCTGDAVVTDGQITTARDMTASLEFANEIVVLLKKDAEDKLVKEDDHNNMTFTFVRTEKKDDDAPLTFAKTEDGEFETFDISKYSPPSTQLLEKDAPADDAELDTELQGYADKIRSLFYGFNVVASIRSIEIGPRIVRFEVVPAKGTKVSRIMNLADDIALDLAVCGIRMEGPIPGKSAVGLEIPNPKPRVVKLRNLIETEEFQSSKSCTAVCIGRDVAGAPVFADIATMPHLIVAGSAGMGKSTAIHSMIASMLCKARPDELRFIMIDPKQVEFGCYAKIPHLLVPIITDAAKTVGALSWAIDEVERRYKRFEELSIRNINAYNEKVAEDSSLGFPMPKIVIIINEIADLMLQVRNPVENYIIRLAQKARSAGIHLILGTQRPNAIIITGAIKSNIPSRLSCKVASCVDSRTVLDMSGAEKLLGKGDMLCTFSGAIKPIRVQGAHISEQELDAMLKPLKENGTNYDKQVMMDIEAVAIKYAIANLDEKEEEEESVGFLNDRQFLSAVEIAVASGKVSTSLLQRKLSIGYGKAAKFIDIMEDMGIVGEQEGFRPREALITPDEWKEKLSRFKREQI